VVEMMRPVREVVGPCGRGGNGDGGVIE
jgi:hypothetical protein